MGIHPDSVVEAIGNEHNRKLSRLGRSGAINPLDPLAKHSPTDCKGGQLLPLHGLLVKRGSILHHALIVVPNRLDLLLHYGIHCRKIAQFAGVIFASACFGKFKIENQ